MLDWGSFPEPLAPFIHRLALLADALNLSEEARRAWQRALTDHPPTAGRVNPLRHISDPSHFALSPAFLPPLPHRLAATAFVVAQHEREAVSHSPAFARGEVTLQSLSSQWAVWVLDPQPGDEVLDLAAAPGGKTALIAAAMDNRGRIAAVEPVKERLFKLKSELTRLGVTCAHTYLTDGRSIGAKTPNRFSRILLDAPCSSDARIHLAKPQSWRHWQPRKIAEAAHKQIGLLRSAWRALAPGGRLVYSTCSYAPEENEWVVAQLLAEAPTARLLPPAWSPPSALAGLPPTAIPAPLTLRRAPQLAPDRAALLAHTRRVLPEDGYTGFFLAIITKDE